MARRLGNPRPKLNSEVVDVIESIERKPHAMYIKYLLTKRVGLMVIIQEMRKLGLSSPSMGYLKKYFQLQIEPLIKKNGLLTLYADYRAKLNGKKITAKKDGKKQDYISGILKYAVDIGEDTVLQAKFCTFIKELGVEVPWSWEIARYHGTVDNFPTDSNGVRILSANMSRDSINKVASSPNRYIIEKLLLENISCTRIAKYCNEHLKENICRSDVAVFKEVFFNTKLNGMEDNIKMLTDEKNFQLSIISDLKNDTNEYASLTVGERA